MRVRMHGEADLVWRSCVRAAALAAFLYAPVAPPAVADDRPESALRYLVSLVPDASSPSLLVALTFQGDSSGRARVVLPEEWGGQEDLHRAILDLHTPTPGATIEESDEPHVRIVRHPPSELVEVRYRVVQDWTGDGPRDGRFYRPVLQPEYMFLIGQALWVYPESGISRPRQIDISWIGIPADWRFANSFGIDQRRQSLYASLNDLRRGVYFAGDFRMHTLTIQDQPVYLFTRGQWAFSEETFTIALARIISVQRDFFDDHDFPFFLVTLLPTADDPGTILGEGRTDGFSLFVSQNEPDIAGVDWLIAHEMFHTWNPGRMGGLSDERLYWFSEGFTDYYASVLLQRAGMRTADEHVRWINEVLRTNYTSAARNLTADQMVVERRRRSDAERLPYQQGTLLAHNWDTELRAIPGASTSLDDVMRRLVKRASDGPLTVERIAAAFGPPLADRVRTEVREHIEQGRTIAPRAAAFWPKWKLAKFEVSFFDPGFDLEPSMAANTISGVRPGSRAAEAGLRDGQRWVGGGMAHDPDAEAEIEIEDDEGRRTIRYYPVTSELVVIPQYVRGEPDSSGAP